MNDAPRQAVTYRRVSTLRQAEEGLSLAAQENTLRQYCDFRGWTITGNYKDAGKSGRTRAKRPGLKGAMGDVAANRGVLVVYSLSRLARSVVDAAEILSELRKAGADLAVVDMALDTSTAAGEMIFNVFSAIAQFESQQHGQRIKAINAHIVDERGYRTMGCKRFGTKFDAEADAMILVPEEQALIQAVIETCQPQQQLAESINTLKKIAKSSPRGRQLAIRKRIAAARKGWQTLNDLCEILNSQQLLSPTGKAWTPDILTRFLRTHQRSA